MSFKYKITGVTTAHLTVDFDNGNWATVPIKKGETKDQIEERIRQFATQTGTSAFDAVSDVPFAVADEATILESDEQREAEAELSRIALDKQVLNYKSQRWGHYPGPALQLEAMYKARQGDSTLLDLVDKTFKDVKARFPKDADTVTMKEYGEAWDRGSIDDANKEGDTRTKRIMGYKDDTQHII